MAPGALRRYRQHGLPGNFSGLIGRRDHDGHAGADILLHQGRPGLPALAPPPDRTSPRLAPHRGSHPLLEHAVGLHPHASYRFAYRRSLHRCRSCDFERAAGNGSGRSDLLRRLHSNCRCVHRGLHCCGCRVGGQRPDHGDPSVDYHHRRPAD